MKTIANAFLSIMTALSVLSGNSALSPPSRESVSLTRVAFVVGDGFTSSHSKFDVCPSDPWSTPPVIDDHEPLSVRVSCGSGTKISYILAGLDWAASINDSAATVLMPDRYRGHPLVEARLNAMRSFGMEIAAYPLPLPMSEDVVPLKWIVVAILGVVAMSALMLVSNHAEPEQAQTRRTVPPRRWSGEATRPPTTH